MTKVLIAVGVVVVGVAIASIAAYSCLLLSANCFSNSFASSAPVSLAIS